MISRLVLAANLHLNSPQPSQCFARLFSATSSHRDSFINHYDVLQLPQDCSQAELKSQFYSLSRQTHPDVNKTDPDASARFSQISESYSVLADPGRRKRHDRDVLRVHQRSQAHSPTPGGRAGGGGGSYAGSRPASGLSKRRGTFRGPPPSFYAHGGRDPPQHSGHATSTAGAGSTTGPGPDFTPPPNTDFDPRPIHRTQTHEDIRRQSRRQAAMAAAQKEMEDDAGFWVRFMMVTGLLIAGVSVAGIFLGLGGSTSVRKGGLTRADGSRRDGAGTGNDWARGGDLANGPTKAATKPREG